MKTYNYLLKHSIRTRVFLSILVGIFAKIVSVPLALIPFYSHLLPINGKSAAAVFDTANSLIQLVPPMNRLLSILIAAPLIENLVFPLMFWLCVFISKKPYLPIAIITILAFYVHPAGSAKITGAVAFFCFAIFYASCKQVVSRKQSYWMTVIAHFVSNVLAVSAMIFLTPLLSS